jgi:PPR repeat
MPIGTSLQSCRGYLLRNPPLCRAFASHSSNNHRDDGIFPSANGGTEEGKQALVERSSVHRSNEQWEQMHASIMSKHTFSVADILGAEQCMRWRVSQCLSLLQSKRESTNTSPSAKGRETSTEAEAVTDSVIYGADAAKAIVAALDLFGFIVKALQSQPDLLHLQTLDNVLDDRLIHWYDGRHPRATHVLNAIIDAWRVCWIDLDNNYKCLPSPEFIFQTLKDNWSDLVPFNERTYTIIMDAPVSTMYHSRSGFPLYHVPLFCEEVINFMLLEKAPKDVPGYPRRYAIETSTLPDNVSYATALNAWVRSGRPDAGLRARNLFNQFVSFCSKGTLSTTPNTFCYNTLLVAMTTPPKSIVQKRATLLEKLSKGKENKDMALIDNLMEREKVLNRADIMFRSMQSCPYPDVVPDAVSYRTIIFAWTDYSLDLRYVNRKMSNKANMRAVALLYEMAQLRVDSGNSTLDIDSSFFGKLISTLALNQPWPPDANALMDLRRAEDIFRFMLKMYDRTNDERFSPDESILSVMILIYAKNGRPQEADDILSRLENEALSQNKHVMIPRIGYYRGMLLFLTKLTAWCALHRCIAFVSNLIQHFDLSLTDTFVSWMDLAAQEMNQGQQNSAIKAADKAENVVLRMIDIACATNVKGNVPDRTIVTRMLELWITCQMPLRAENFYRIVEEIYEKTKFRELRWKATQLRRILTAWAMDINNPTIHSAQRAEAVLNEMQRRFEQTKDFGFRPTVVSISLVLTAWLRTDYPDIVTKCKGLFDNAVSAYVNGNAEARPDATLYSLVFKAFVKVGDGQGAMDFLGIMQKDYFDNKNDSAKPTTEVFNTVLLCLVRSRDPLAPRHALDVFHMMQSLTANLGMEPDCRTFSMLSEILQYSNSKVLIEKRQFFIEQHDLLAKQRDGINKTQV